jgi:hypothetical protein
VNLLVSSQPLHGAAWVSASGSLDGRWLRVMGDRPPGQLVCFTLCDAAGEEAACTTGYVITDPQCYDAFNWHRLLWSRDGVFAEQPESTVTLAPPVQRCFPMLALVQPGYDFGVHTVEGADKQCVEELLRAIHQWAGANRLVCVAALYAQGELRGPLTRLGWLEFRGADRAVAPLTGRTSFQDFRAALSRNARKQIGADQRVLSSNSVAVTAASVSQHVPVVLALRSELVEKYGSYVDQSEDCERLARLLDTYGDDGLRLFLARTQPASLPLGFALFVVTGQHAWSAFWVGSCRRDPRSDRVYFGCLFYAAIASALDSGVTLIDYGLGAEDAKLRRGCRPLTRNVFVALTPGLSIDPAALDGERRIAPRS